MSNKSSGKTLLIIGCVAIIACCACFGVLRAYVLIKMEVHQASLEQTAERLGVEPTIWGIREYIEESIEPGMTRAEVEEVLNTIAPIEVVERGELVVAENIPGWKPMACDRIVLKLNAPSLPVPGKWPMSACYDSQGRLVGLGSGRDDLPRIDIFVP